MGNRTLTDNNKARNVVLECPLFNQFSTEKVDSILGCSRLVDLAEGEFLVQQGDPANEFFLVLSGELKLATSSSTGQEKILHIIHPGQTFAEVLMFLGKPRYPASVEALVKTRLIGFSSDSYKSVLAESIDACFGLLGEFALRNRQLVGEIEALTLYNATFRVVQYLLKEIPSNQHDATSVKLRAPKNVIASRLAITPETLSRILSKLKRDGIIQVSDKQVTLQNIDWMRKFVADA
ncbi:MAG: Crp/Fnr family transcriptional regulator [Desulfobacterales bacterium]|nr:Crp/Fnr family transcriptional regulator [Desulfobacterales bacterium]